MTGADEVAYTDDQALSDTRGYLDERADSGVIFARAVSNLIPANGVLTATFDAEGSANISTELFRELCPFENLAEFVDRPAGWKTEEAAKIRSRVSRVETLLANGDRLGSATGSPP